MKNCENLYLMHSKDVHFISVDVPLTDINETIEAWLFDDEDYPAHTMRRDSLILDGDRKTHEPKNRHYHEYIKTSNHQISFIIVFCI
jgi:hypothetical protein